MSASQIRTPLRAVAAGLAVGLVALATSPASAASTVSRGTASAVKLAITTNDAYSGSYTATNDGSKETTSGDNKPAITILGGQGAVNQGTLNQDATAKAPHGKGKAAACAGLSGDGATVAGVGKTTCLGKSKSTASLGAGSLDFSDFDPTTGIIDANGDFTQAFLDQLPAALKAALTAGGKQLATQLSAALQQALTQLGNPSLSLDVGVIQGRCTATSSKVTGDAELVGVDLVADLGTYATQNGIDPIKIPLSKDTHPKPNTKAVTHLDEVTKAYTDALTKALLANGGALGQLFAGLGNAVGQLADLVNPIIGQISSQLGPLQDNVLDVTLNVQPSHPKNQIHVTALDATVLNAAKASAGAPLAHIQIGDVTCGAVNRTTPQTHHGGVPTSIDSGLPGDSGDGNGVLTVLGVLAILTGVGLGARRLLTAKD